MSENSKTIFHSQFGDNLIDDLKIIFYNNSFYIYEDGYYKKAKNKIELKMIELSNDISYSKRNEVLKYLEIKTSVDDTDIQCNPYIINLKNTRFDIRTGKKLDFDSKSIEFQKLPVIYDPLSESKILDDVIKKVFVNDHDLIDLFYEMIGYSLIKNCHYDKAFIFYGSGSNGKSTILELIENFFGSANYSTIELDKLTQRFHSAELENKYINIGDDINSKAIKDVGTIKNIFSGNAIQVERKGEKPFTLKPYAKHIFACNEIPKVSDQSDGIYRRLVFIPFNAKFSKQDFDYDPLISEKLKANDVLSTLLNKAILGAKRLITNNGFTEPQSVKSALEDYKIANSLVLTWINEESLNKMDFVDHKTRDKYSKFQVWCSMYNHKDIPSITIFNQEIRKKYGLETPQKKSDGKQFQYFKEKD